MTVILICWFHMWINFWWEHQMVWRIMMYLVLMKRHLKDCDKKNLKVPCFQFQGNEADLDCFDESHLENSCKRCLWLKYSTFRYYGWKFFRWLSFFTQHKSNFMPCLFISPLKNKKNCQQKITMSSDILVCEPSLHNLFWLVTVKQSDVT